jgi:predicted extracellular nuclease
MRYQKIKILSLSILLFGAISSINLISVESQRAPLLLATWNVENFFDTEDDPTHDDSVFPAEAVRAKIDSIASTIRSINPDLIALQEVENLEVLQQLNQRGNLNYPNVILVEGNDPRGIDVGLLTRLKVNQVKSHKDDMLPQFNGVPPNYRFSRDCLEVHLEADSLQFVALLNHFVSKSSGVEESLPKRLSQARRVRSIVDELQSANPDVRVVVLGDLNDTPDSSPIKALTKKKPKASRLYEATSVLPASDRFSFVFRGAGELIDYALFTQSFRPLIVNDSIRIIHNPEIDQASDHDPVVVGLRLP